MEHLAIVAAGVVGITQVFKMLGVPTKFLPLIATVLGGALAFALTPEAGIKGVVLGIVEGLSATGLVDFGQNFRNDEKKIVNVSNNINKGVNSDASTGEKSGK